MSRFPSVDGVAQVRVLIEKATVLSDEIDALRETIRTATKRLAIAEEEYGAAASERHKLMEKMDCTSTGNYGYEHRIQVFLSELVKQTTAAASGSNNQSSETS